MSNFERLLLFYDGNWIVSPFNLLWGQSAMTRVAQLAHQFPEHSAKYDWFLGLYEAAAAGAMLLPPGETFS